ncbi:TPA: hypothetical protein QHB43_001682 [Aeromonas hydrophila subsp. hydrophila]|nr:hypothetical protein [Aeromonas hydrophila subsp. hydrophila]
MISGHWHHNEIPEGSDAFTYKVTLQKGKDIKYYVGYKCISKHWQIYQTSSQAVKDLMCDGYQTHFEIIEFFQTKQEAIDRETQILISINARTQMRYVNEQVGRKRGTLVPRSDLAIAASEQRKKEKEDAMNLKLNSIADAVIDMFMATNDLHMQTTKLKPIIRDIAKQHGLEDSRSKTGIVGNIDDLLEQRGLVKKNKRYKGEPRIWWFLPDDIRRNNNK